MSITAGNFRQSSKLQAVDLAVSNRTLAFVLRLLKWFLYYGLLIIRDRLLNERSFLGLFEVDSRDPTWAASSGKFASRLFAQKLYSLWQAKKLSLLMD